ncbi:MAG: general secretion pathway protein GspB [Sedimentisphaerales bacterium]|nr:general secretion pathway protein GspB [Sedimentisphaerales bacterium]
MDDKNTKTSDQLISDQDTAEQPKQQEVSETKIKKAELKFDKIQKIKDKLFAKGAPLEDPRQRVMAILIPMLSLIFVVVFTKVSGISFPSKASANIVAPSPDIKLVDDIKNWQIPEPYPKDLRDPMQFGSAGATASGHPIITGIVYSDDPTVMINGRIFRQGDEVVGAKIVKINKNSVVFKSGNQEWEQKVRH